MATHSFGHTGERGVGCRSVEGEVFSFVGVGSALFKIQSMLKGLRDLGEEEIGDFSLLGEEEGSSSLELYSDFFKSLRIKESTPNVNFTEASGLVLSISKEESVTSTGLGVCRSLSLSEE